MPPATPSQQQNFCTKMHKSPVLGLPAPFSQSQNYTQPIKNKTLYLTQNWLCFFILLINPNATRRQESMFHSRSPKRIQLTPSQEDIRLSLAILALEDGTVFEGRSFGAPAERSGEVVFNTAITGYQEIFTDPSYSGQIVILTNPQIGNYGTSTEDNESARPYIEGLAVREFSAISSNWRSDRQAEQFLAASGIPIISDLDTRTLVRHLRTK